MKFIDEYSFNKFKKLDLYYVTYKNKNIFSIITITYKHNWIISEYIEKNYCTVDNEIDNLIKFFIKSDEYQFYNKKEIYYYVDRRYNYIKEYSNFILKKYLKPSALFFNTNSLMFLDNYNNIRKINNCGKLELLYNTKQLCS